jgi:hypothetical protein
VKQAGNKESMVYESTLYNISRLVESTEPEKTMVLSKWVEGDMEVLLVHSDLKAL